MTPEPHCNHDPAAVQDGVCECGQHMAIPLGDFMRNVLDLFPNALISTEPDGELLIHTGLHEVHDESGAATAEPLDRPVLTGI